MRRYLLSELVTLITGNQSIRKPANMPQPLQGPLVKVSASRIQRKLGPNIGEREKKECCTCCRIEKNLPFLSSSSVIPYRCQAVWTGPNVTEGRSCPFNPQSGVVGPPRDSLPDIPGNLIFQSILTSQSSWIPGFPFQQTRGVGSASQDYWD